MHFDSPRYHNFPSNSLGNGRDESQRLTENRVPNLQHTMYVWAAAVTLAQGLSGLPPPACPGDSLMSSSRCQPFNHCLRWRDLPVNLAHLGAQRIGDYAPVMCEDPERYNLRGIPMLTETQLTTVWERQIDAEVRSFYFADLTHRYSLQKQVITFTTFFLASGAAATLVGKCPSWVAIVLSLVAALLIAYSVAFNIDGKVMTMSKLHGEWATLAVEYESLRDGPDGENAGSILRELLRRDLEASRIATTDAPHDEKRMDRWADHVFQAHGLANG